MRQFGAESAPNPHQGSAWQHINQGPVRGQKWPSYPDSHPQIRRTADAARRASDFSRQYNYRNEGQSPARKKSFWQAAMTCNQYVESVTYRRFTGALLARLHRQVKPRSRAPLVVMSIGFGFAIMFHWIASVATGFEESPCTALRAVPWLNPVTWHT